MVIGPIIPISDASLDASCHVICLPDVTWAESVSPHVSVAINLPARECLGLLKV